jgi:hypothetical protein
MYSEAVSRLTICASVLAIAASMACSRVPPLAHTHPSASSLAAAVLDALARSDRAALEALAVNESEFRDHVWPQLPAARPERNLPFSYVWGELHQKSGQGLSAAISREGGKRYELIDVRFDGDTDYRTYRVHRETTLRVRDDSGMELDLRVFGSMLEQRGVWKVFSYVVDS